MACYFLVVFLVSTRLAVTFASAGDKDPMFQRCTKACMLRNCTEPDFLNSIIHWSCEGDCQYDCMFSITHKRQNADHDILQYYGKWPFYRFAGIQEPAAFLFSLMNLLAQIVGWLHYRKHVSVNYEFYGLNKTQFIVNSFAWICASVFHSRDTYWTEKMDYFSAAGVIAISLFTCLTQVIGRMADVRSYLTGIFLSVLFCGHIFYMAAIRFDYGYNMMFLATSGVVNILIWLIWCWQNRTKKPFAWKCALSMGGTLCLAAFEIWDFPPFWFILDGHALWHLGTSPVAYLWFSFLTDNAVHEVSRNLKLA